MDHRIFSLLELYLGYYSYMKDVIIVKWIIEYLVLVKAVT